MKLLADGSIFMLTRSFSLETEYSGEEFRER
jgi:hypothetical protein